MNTYVAGQPAEIETVPPFTVEDTGVVTDPSVVILYVQVNRAPATAYTYGNGSTVVKVATGTYKAVLDTSNWAGCTITYWWVGDPDGTPSPECQTVSTPNRFLVVSP